MTADVRYALRQLWQSPSFTIAAIVSLAIGMTALTVTFSGVNAILFRDIPGIVDLDRVLRIGAVRTETNYRLARAIRTAEFEHFRQTLTVFTEMAAWRPVQVAADIGGEPQAVRAERVTSNYFSVLRSPVAVALRPDDGEPATVLSHGFAVRRFGTPEAAIGAAIRINGVAVRIVAVAPAGFTGTNAAGFGESEADRTQLWLALGERASERGGTDEDPALQLIGRLKASETLASARAQAAAAAPTSDGAVPIINRVPLRPTDSAQEIATGVAVIFAMPVIVLIVGCANAANLLLARATRRRAEIAVRLSLGATRIRIVRQLLAESLLLAVGAGALGVGATVSVIAATRTFLPVPAPVDSRVAVFALLATVATGLLFGLAPALAATRGDLIGPLRDSTSEGAPRSRLRRGLVIAQIALSLLLLVMAGLFLRTLQHLHSVEALRNVSNVAALTLNLSVANYSPAAGAELQRALLERAEQIPGVTAAAIASRPPFSGSAGLRYWTTDHPTAEERYAQGGGHLGRFIETAGLTVIAGRNFLDEDRRGVPASALVNEAFARQAWPGDEPLGRRLLVQQDAEPVSVTIVGVTRDVLDPLDNRQRPAIYLPSPLAFQPSFALWVRTAGDPRRLLPHLRQIVGELDPRLPIVDMGAADVWWSRNLGPTRWIATALGALGSAALLLAAGGLYAVMTYLVAARRHELGVRSALGARPRDLLTLVGREAMKLTSMGIAAGLLLAGLSAKIVQALLVGISPFDLVAFGVVSALMTIVAFVASASPARRAAIADPMAVLRRS